ncbi:amidohydrolase [Shimazuella sp. AN120528]|uniref:M20 metallopeptidase family protein n=1 Tax=Shimazuella soli TaxID=1892854 RepID=UPI001F0D1FAF|nr:amidohydrolase [Shimazuella soli]MCH5586692.1 amidohydrolase [Shimazuella soli]
MNHLALLQNTSQSKWYQWMARHFYFMHQHPELSFQERNTIRYITTILEKNLGLKVNLYDVNGEIFGKSVSSQAITVSFGQGERTVIFTADFDALPIEEASTNWYRSKTYDTMHACGHDMHTSILLGIAWWLKQHEDILNCRVILLFRPAEELNGTAFLIKSEKLLDYLGKDAVCFGLHVYPELPAGKISTCPGLINYSAEFLKIEVKGKGGHTARPEHSYSALTVIGQVLSQLPEFIAHDVPEAVLAFGQIHSGSKGNIIPETAWCEGTLRTPEFRFHERARTAIHNYVRSLENDFVKLELKNSGIPALPPVVNDPVLVEDSYGISEHFPWIEVQHTESSRGADDISWFSELGYPLHFFRLGTKPVHQQQIFDLHSPHFEADPRALLTGVYFQLYQLIKFMEKNEVTSE